MEQNYFFLNDSRNERLLQIFSEKVRVLDWPTGSLSVTLRRSKECVVTVTRYTEAANVQCPNLKWNSA